MDISVYPEAKFKFVLTKDQVRVLMWLSEHHYDMMCQSYSRNGGLLYGYNNMVTYCEEPHTCSASWHSMDILCKILEITIGMNKDDVKIARDLSSSFHRAMSGWSILAKDMQWEV